MTGKRLVGAGLLALSFGSGCGDVTPVEPSGEPSAMAANGQGVFQGQTLHVNHGSPHGPSSVPSVKAAKGPTVFQGEKIHANSVINVLYDWDVGEDGPVVYASRPMGPARWPEHNNENSIAFIYVVVYPVGSTVTGLMCYDTPMETCPDHGPDVAAGAMQINPAVYGGGVLGHDHMSPKRAAHAYAVFMLFTNAEAANTHITTRAQVHAAVAAGDAFLVPVPELSFHNAPVDGRIYELATPWICPAYTFCSP